MKYLHEYISTLLFEKEIRSQKDKRTLYHVGKRPAAPKPKMRWFERGQADEEWVRHWLESPVRSGVFLSPNPVDIAQFHGVSGNVYAYRVPEWVIEKSGGIHRFDQGSEVLIPGDVWEEAGSEIEFLGKSMDQQELLSKIDMSMRAFRGRKGNPQKPGWMSTEEWKQDQAREASGNHLIGLRATKHLENAVKMMTPAERAEALEAFEQAKPRSKLTWPDWAKSQMDDWDRPRTEKDLEIMATLQKYLNESIVREYVRGILSESSQQQGRLNEGILDFLGDMFKGLGGAFNKVKIDTGKFETYGVDTSVLREYIRGALNEGVEFREVDSPLTYHRAANVKRLALCDTAVTDPPGQHDHYFAEIEKWRKYTKSGRRRLKKPVLDEVIPGVSDNCILGFLDYHSQGKYRGKEMWYIDYMKTRDEFGGQKVASRLVDEFFNRHADTASHVHFGKMMHPSIGHLKDKMAEKYPDVIVIGATNY